MEDARNLKPPKLFSPAVCRPTSLGDRKRLNARVGFSVCAGFRPLLGPLINPCTDVKLVERLIQQLTTLVLASWAHLGFLEVQPPNELVIVIKYYKCIEIRPKSNATHPRNPNPNTFLATLLV